MDTAPEGMRLGKGQVRGKGRCGGYGGARSFLCEVCFPFVSMTFFLGGKGMGDIRGRKYICVAIERRIGGRS